jgi:hypothetical protein
MSARQRILAFGSTALMAVVGIVCELLARDLTAETVGIVLMLLGFLGLLMLVFLEVGLSEDRARAREGARLAELAQQAERPAARHPPRRLRPPRRPRRPG